jgi:putative integral membrane protein (TIGR02587 family)
VSEADPPILLAVALIGGVRAEPSTIQNTRCAADMKRHPKPSPDVSHSLREYGRGIVGGLLFSLPLLYTMEVWWGGLAMRPGRQIVCVLATFVLLLGYNRYAGLRRDSSWAEVGIDSVEEMGLGLLLSAATLFLLGRVTAENSINEILGPVVLEAMIVAIGVSVGTAQLGGGSPEERSDMGMESGESRAAGRRGSRKESDEVSFEGQVVIAFCGAILFAANIAPTEEIVMVAVEASSWQLLGLALASLLLGGCTLYYSNFVGAERIVRTEGRLEVFRGTVVTYAVGVAASALILWFFGRFDGVAPITALSESVVLGLPATLGASAGRLLLQ